MTTDPLALALVNVMMYPEKDAASWAPALRQALAAQGVYLVDAESLAAALIESGLMRRFMDYANRAHPETMYPESPEAIAASWSPDILAAIKEPQP